MAERKRTQESRPLEAVASRDLPVGVGDPPVADAGTPFAVLYSAASVPEGWRTSTRVCNVPGGCLVQVSTQQRNNDGTYAVAEALTFCPGVWVDVEAEPRRFVAIPG